MYEFIQHVTLTLQIKQRVLWNPDIYFSASVWSFSGFEAPVVLDLEKAELKKTDHMR